MKKKFIIILFMSLLVYNRAAYAVFDIAACIESVLEYKTEIEHKIQEIQKKLKDMETRVRQGFDLTNSCFKNPLECNPKDMTRFLNYMNEDIKGRTKAFSAWGFGMNHVMDGINAEKPNQEGFIKGIETGYTYNRGQGQDLAKLNENRKDVNTVVSNEIALLFAKGATTHNEIQQEKDSDLYTSEFPEGMDTIMQAQARVALMTAARLARVLEFRSNMISSAATAQMTLQNQENLGD
jgi:hypothetical protein